MEALRIWVRNMEKKEIRKYVFQKRKELTEKECVEKSQQICEKILQMESFQKAEWVYVYMDFIQEVSTKPLIEAAWAAGKHVAAPKVFGEQMRYFEIRSYDDVMPGYFGIPEPFHTEEEAKCENALLIVPGVGFDENRHRCGYGKGFYDRYLSVHREHNTIAVSFEFQMVDEVPADQYDIFPQILVTEKRIIK